MSKIVVTLKRSTNNCSKKQIATVEALGLKKIGSSVEKEATPAILGMVRRVAHLVECKEA